MKNLPLLIGTIVGTLLFIVAVAFFFSKWSTAQDTTIKEAGAEILLSQTSNSKGPADAPITIVEFSDLQCPACKAVQPLIQQVMEKYPNQVRLVFRHYPLFSLHQHAGIAAQAAEAVAEIAPAVEPSPMVATQAGEIALSLPTEATQSGKFWQFHDLLFARQEEWAKAGSQDQAIDLFIKYAGELGIDTTGFKKKIVSEDIKARVLKDVTDGNTLGINSTPTFYINNKKVPAPQQLLSIVESLIQK